MKARELAMRLLQHPDAEVVINIPWAALAQTYLGDTEIKCSDDRCCVAVVELSTGWLPSGVVDIVASDEIIMG
jgi:hypothetical protein